MFLDTSRARALVSYGLLIAFDSVSLTWISSVPLDVLSIGFGNENDLHGLMKLSAFSPFCQRGGGWLVALCGYQGRRPDLSSLVLS